MSYEAWRREVANGTMPDWDEDSGDYVGGSGGGPRVLVCVACEKRYWEDDMVRRGACDTPYCLACDPLATQEYCDTCGYDVSWCQCGRRQP